MLERMVNAQCYIIAVHIFTLTEADPVSKKLCFPVQRSLDSFSLGVLQRNDIYRKTIGMGGLYKIGFVQGPHKLNAGSRKTIYSGMIK
jgi:hypothetical protein